MDKKHLNRVIILIIFLIFIVIWFWGWGASMALASEPQQGVDDLVKHMIYGATATLSYLTSVGTITVDEWPPVEELRAILAHQLMMMRIEANPPTKGVTK